MSSREYWGMIVAVIGTGVAACGLVVALQANTGARLDGMDNRLSAHIDGVEDRLSAHIDGVEDRLSARIDSVEDRLSARIDSVEDRLGARIDDIEAQLDAVQSELYTIGQRVAHIEGRLDVRLPMEPNPQESEE